MSAHFSFSYFCYCYLFLLLVVSLFHLCLSNKSFDDDVLCMGIERQALLQFKHGLIDEAGRLASWDDGEERDCCRWAGIGCDNITGHVHRIHLPAFNGHCPDDFTKEQRLGGDISPSLLHLKQLRQLDLSCNNFGGIEFPKFIGSLRNLRYLNLSNSYFFGSIPPQLGNLSELQVLCLGNFYRPYETRSMMNMHWLSSLRMLHHLDLNGVDLSKSIDWLQVINTLPSLIQLHLSNCELADIHLHIPSLNLTSLSVLDLSHNNFNSSLPWWIFSITSLVSLDLNYCSFHGLIPSNIYTFRNLTSLESLNVHENNFMNSSIVLRDLSSVGSNLISLDISSCRISSSALDSLHNLTSVRSLDLSYNQLTLRIPEALGNFCNLRDLHLSDNDFSNISLTSLLKSVFMCKSPALESLSLISSELSGTIPNSIGRLSFLRSLDLSWNRLSGTIPDSIGRISFLRSLDLSWNRLSGSIPDSIGRLSFLRSLDLSLNLLSGPIPYSIGPLTSLKKLDLHRNQLNGGLPDSIGRLSSLEVLDLSNNSIAGTIPDSLGRLSSLEVLYLSDNQLNGSLPNSLGQLSNLESFDFSFNLVTGVVTEAHFSKLVNLKQLDGGGNNLTLRLANWIPPFQLIVLKLNSWGLGPQFPLWLQSQKDLYLLDISNTGISSPMPPGSFWRLLPNIIFLNMSQNHIQGTLKLLDIPAKFYTLDLSSNELTGELAPIPDFSLLYFLDLSNNLFAGSLHDLLCSNGVKQMNALYLGNNHLSGVIPECWEKCPLLEFLELENNNFSGGIPTTLGFSSKLKSLNMQGNKLSGRLPASLMNLTKLKILKLGRNELIGSIPSWFGTELSQLRLLNLRSNCFDGNIPHELCYLKYIQILDLADNNLSGNIPRCFNNFSVLSGKETTSGNQFMDYLGNFSKLVSDSLVMKGQEYTYSTILPLVMLLDLSNNNISGNIPSELTVLLKLKSLNLSRNHLTGRIPENIGNMKALETFDLSLNKLSEELPMSLSSMSFLISFNVSDNNLTGRVPSSTQIQSFNESSFFGNKLCGPPLTQHCAFVVEVPDTEDQKEDDGANWGFIISVVLGFVSGLWIVLAPLIVSKSWRIAYFRFMNERGYMVYDFMHKYWFNMFSK